MGPLWSNNVTRDFRQQKRQPQNGTIHCNNWLDQVIVSLSGSEIAPAEKNSWLGDDYMVSDFILLGLHDCLTTLDEHLSGLEFDGAKSGCLSDEF